MKNISILFLILCFTTSSCIKFKKKDTDESRTEIFNTVTVDDEYRVGIPKFMRNTTGLNEEAALQYQNAFKEAYTIIIGEPKQEFVDVFMELDQYNENISLLQNYREIQLQSFTSTISVSMESEIKPLKINGLDAESVQIDGSVEGINEEIAYFLTFIEGTENIYMMMSWTLKSKKEEHKKTFETIAQSFELIDQETVTKV
ncbi:hypothetical protein [Flagellimonas sediminis]|uniref:Tfp pilus assembly protein, major pilin PilA n=1 Tax=Flagellimonas sediminis TaxID=2696468 RepID=A0A6I5KTL6_9FLAO|nr:hypothetical protein [Allomuricauda sediminis]NDV43957.1 hypothetical protein [Allomuricauda sediminis]